jgi:hypothetical protein
MPAEAKASAHSQDLLPEGLVGDDDAQLGNANGCVTSGELQNVKERIDRLQGHLVLAPHEFQGKRCSLLAGNQWQVKMVSSLLRF